MPAPFFVLIHSPLVGPYVWSLVAGQLRHKGYGVALPVLESRSSGAGTYWERHVEQVAASLGDLSHTTALILVGHSGAGPLLLAIKHRLGLPVAAYLFVDAMLPQDGKSRLDLFEDSLAADQFRSGAKDGLLPV